VSTGVPGLAIMLALIIATAVAALRKTRGDQCHRMYAIGMVSALCAYYAAVFFSFSEAMTGWLPWLLMGALLGTAAMAHPHDAPTTVVLPNVVPDDAPARTSAISAISAGGGAPTPRARRRSPESAPLVGVTVRAAGCIAGALLIASACALLFADRADGRAGREADAGHIDAAVDDARLASRVNPLEPQYFYDLGTYQEDAADAGEPAALTDALTTYRTVDRRFAPTAYGVLSEARVMARMYDAQPASVDLNAIDRLLARGLALDPYNADAQAEIARIRVSIGEQPTP
jgi:hypothetical protein